MVVSAPGMRERIVELRRTLRPLDAVCVVIGAIIGVGIFFTPTQVARIAGSAELTLWAWTLGGGIALCGALTFASLGSAYTSAGAQYEALRDAYGPLVGFLFVFCNATAIQAGGTAIIAVICAQNIAVALAGEVCADWGVLVLAVGLIAGLMVANCLGVLWGAWIQNVTVFAKVAVLVAIGLVAISLAPARVPSAPASLPSAVTGATRLAVLFSAIVPAFFSYGGWQQALWIAGEVRNARRNVPLAMLIGVSIVVVVYLLANWAYLRLLGYEGVVGSRTLAADAIATVWPAWGRRAVAAGVAVSAFGVLNSQLLSGPRLVYRLAADGRFFRPFALASGRYGTPIASILLLGCLALVLLVAAGRERVDRLLTGVVFVDGIFFVLTGLAVVLLRWRRVVQMRSYGYPWIPLLFSLGEMGVVLGAYRDTTTRAAAHIGVAWIVVAAALYLALFRGRSRVAVQPDDKEVHDDPVE